jgi:ribose-phosphate pyrophosphokinase
MIKLLVNNEEVKFTTTIFPDGTSQIWKIEREPDKYFDQVKIQWLFESEAELFHVCQLAQLCYSLSEKEAILEVPYLPYGRQDKEISNVTSFSARVFRNIIMSNRFYAIETYDAHSGNAMVDSEKPTAFHESVLKNNYDVICYPDKGARERYSITGVDSVYAQKLRDQYSGDILGLELVTNYISLENKKILIVDDICDGGLTFIKVTEELKKHNPKQVDLAVSHGLFSKGKGCLYDAGIANIYTTNSLLRNPEGFKVW